jgi:hypothetical protein
MARLRLLVWVGLLSAAIAPALWGDTLITKNGSSFSGTVREEGNKYVLVTSQGGSMEFPKGMVAMVERSAASGPSGAAPAKPEGGGAWTESVSSGAEENWASSQPTTAPVTPQTIRFDGVYQTQEMERQDRNGPVKYRIYYRFFRDGNVIVSNQAFPDAAAAIKNLRLDTAQVRGRFEIKGGQLLFSTHSDAGAVNYAGYAASAGLRLDVDSRINNMKLAFNLSFVADSTAPASAPSGQPQHRIPR